MDEGDMRVMMVEIKGAVIALAETVNLKLDRLGDKIETGDNRTMQALLLTDERLTGLAGRHVELAKRVDQSFESLGKRLDLQRDKVDSLDISRAKLYGAMGAMSFLTGASGVLLGHLWH